jgi:hypothetical protein
MKQKMKKGRVRVVYETHKPVVVKKGEWLHIIEPKPVKEKARWIRVVEREPEPVRKKAKWMRFPYVKEPEPDLKKVKWLPIFIKTVKERPVNLKKVKYIRVVEKEPEPLNLDKMTRIIEKSLKSYKSRKKGK